MRDPVGRFSAKFFDVVIDFNLWRLSLLLWARAFQSARVRVSVRIYSQSTVLVRSRDFWGDWAIELEQHNHLADACSLSPTSHVQDLDCVSAEAAAEELGDSHISRRQSLSTSITVSTIKISHAELIESRESSSRSSYQIVGTFHSSGSPPHSFGAEAMQANREGMICCKLFPETRVTFYHPAPAPHSFGTEAMGPESKFMNCCKRSHFLSLPSSVQPRARLALNRVNFRECQLCAILCAGDPLLCLHASGP